MGKKKEKKTFLLPPAPGSDIHPDYRPPPPHFSSALAPGRTRRGLDAVVGLCPACRRWGNRWPIGAAGGILLPCERPPVPPSSCVELPSGGAFFWKIEAVFLSTQGVQSCRGITKFIPRWELDKRGKHSLLEPNVVHDLLCQGLGEDSNDKGAGERSARAASRQPARRRRVGR